MESALPSAWHMVKNSFIHSFFQRIIVAQLPCVLGAEGVVENKTEEVLVSKKFIF